MGPSVPLVDPSNDLLTKDPTYEDRLARVCRGTDLQLSDPGTRSDTAIRDTAVVPVPRSRKSARRKPESKDNRPSALGFTRDAVPAAVAALSRRGALTLRRPLWFPLVDKKRRNALSERDGPGAERLERIAADVLVDEHVAGDFRACTERRAQCRSAPQVERAGDAIDDGADAAVGGGVVCTRASPCRSNAR